MGWSVPYIAALLPTYSDTVEEIHVGWGPSIILWHNCTKARIGPVSQSYLCCSAVRGRFNLLEAPEPTYVSLPHAGPSALGFLEHPTGFPAAHGCILSSEWPGLRLPPGLGLSRYRAETTIET
ncbi:uncharacterized protein LY79DRAFT_581858 [Colletotrichum navitas]|uniref:Uncharacterized protein n=1 Tax=Colletotrichum navitas TaxID=681940 RepID=A0AAD8PTF8_9PEZI|nr:uncharacterized protein LY79DRAFT_581858 [Colletotrichum navitas]KAK1580426.1 hypothetical protein LY79DRAFT_581858 [Colletotrichum navitas]